MLPATNGPRERRPDLPNDMLRFLREHVMSANMLNVVGVPPEGRLH